MDESSVTYHTKVMDNELLDKVTQEAKNIHWCIPPAGIPGNNPPRYVGALGDGSNITMIGGRIAYVKNNTYPNITSYPLYQCAKNSSAQYLMKKIPKNIAKLIVKLRKLVQKSYGNKAKDINKMFNVCVCNYYTEDTHQIADHRDDERWLSLNQLDNNNNPAASIIASLTLYIDEAPKKLRRFQVYDDSKNAWKNYELEHNSVLLFSNHRHRAPKVIGGNSCKRINITFRTLSPGLLGLTGYGNFYRYMSIPHQINYVNDKHLEHARHFINSAISSNIFNGKKILTKILI